YTEHGECVYPWCWRRLRLFLRVRRLLERACRCGIVSVGKHPRWLRWRSGAVEAPRIRLWLLAGDDLRLSVLPAYLWRDGDRIGAEFRESNVSHPGRRASGRSCYELPGRG